MTNCPPGVWRHSSHQWSQARRGLRLIAILLFVYQPSLHASCAEFLEPHFLISSQDAREIRARPSGEYRIMRKFAADHATKLFQMVVGSKEESTIVIAMGGAVQLGTLLRKAIGIERLTGLSVQEIFLTSAIVGDWNSIRVPSALSASGAGPSRWTRNADQTVIFLDRHEIVAGHNTPEEIFNYIRQRGILEKSEVVVVDTGFRATIAEVIASAARHFRKRVKVRSVLLCKNPDFLLRNTIEVQALGDADMRHQKLYSPYWWAMVFDEEAPAHGLDRLEADYEFYGNPLARRRDSATCLKLIDGVWQPDGCALLPSQWRAIRRWKHTVLGIEDGTTEAFTRD